MTQNGKYVCLYPAVRCSATFLCYIIRDPKHTPYVWSGNKQRQYLQMYDYTKSDEFQPRLQASVRFHQHWRILPNCFIITLTKAPEHLKWILPLHTSMILRTVERITYTISCKLLQDFAFLPEVSSLKSCVGVANLAMGLVSEIE